MQTRALAEELALFRMVVEAAGLNLFGPTFDFFWCFFLAALIEPFDHLLVACSLLDLRFEIISPYAFESEKRVVEGAIEMVFGDLPRHQCPAFVDRAAKNRVTPEANARAARRLFS